MRIALLEDDLDQAKVVQLWLEEGGHHTQHYANGKSFIRGIAGDSFDLLIFDWVLPDMSGDQVLLWVRENIDWHIPVLFVTVRDEEKDIVHALESGADDYMVKPLRHMELLARVHALGRRHGHEEEGNRKLEMTPYVLDPSSRSVTYQGKQVEMTHKEFDLALFLFRNVGRILSRGHILESVWGRNPDLNTRTVDTHISRLRNKLELNQQDNWRLSAVYQHGYRLESLNQPSQISAAQ